MNEPHKANRPLQRRRVTSFSLRTALIAVTVFGVWLGLHIRSVRRQQAVVEVVHRQGGQVHYDYELNENLRRSGLGASPLPMWLLTLLGRDHFHDVVSVDVGLGGESGNAEVLRHLSHLPGLEMLLITKAPPDSSELKLVGELPALRVLVIRDGGRIAENDPVYLSDLKQLERLVLGNCQMSEKSLRSLSSLPRLEELWMQNSHFADGGLKHVQNMPRLRVLALGSNITDSDLVHLKTLTRLERLGIQYSGVTEGGLRHLTGLKNLRYLWLEGTPVRDASWLQKQLPNCDILL